MLEVNLLIDVHQQLDLRIMLGLLGLLLQLDPDLELLLLLERMRLPLGLQLD